jgi:DME family drug/metabolite transporter
VSKPETTSKQPALNGGWMVLAAAVLWGTTGTAQAFAPPGAAPMAVGAVRLMIGTLALGLIAARQGHLSTLRDWRAWPVLVTVLAAAAVAAFQLLFFAGVSRTGVAVGTIVGIGSTPIAAGIFTYLAYRQIPGRRWIAATILALLGCGLLILQGQEVQIDPWGVLLAMGAGAAYALYTLLSKVLLGQQPRGAVLFVTFTLGSLFLLPVLFTADMAWLREPMGMLVALHLGIVTVGIAYQLFAVGLTTISVASAATLTLLEPLTATVLGVFVLGETLSPQALAGIGFVLAGLVLLVYQPRRRAIPGVPALPLKPDLVPLESIDHE